MQSERQSIIKTCPNIKFYIGATRCSKDFITAKLKALMKRKQNKYEQESRGHKAKERKANILFKFRRKNFLIFSELNIQKCRLK